MSEHFVYLLKEVDGYRTYIGYTNNLERRLRMHNGEIKGGAKYTTGRKWEFILYLSGFPSNIIALQCEWRCKHPYGKKKRGKSGDIGRIEGIKHVLSDERFTSNSYIDIIDLDIVVNIKQKYAYLFNDNKNKVIIIEEKSVYSKTEVESDSSVPGE
jgi:predicted GIY-YIG superfamily endonuclease